MGLIFIFFESIRYSSTERAAPYQADDDDDEDGFGVPRGLARAASLKEDGMASAPLLLVFLLASAARASNSSGRRRRAAADFSGNRKAAADFSACECE